MAAYVRSLLVYVSCTVRTWTELSNKKNIIKVYIKTAPTCFGVTVTPSSGSALICAY